MNKLGVISLLLLGAGFSAQQVQAEHKSGSADGYLVTYPERVLFVHYKTRDVDRRARHFRHKHSYHRYSDHAHRNYRHYQLKKKPKKYKSNKRRHDSQRSGYYFLGYSDSGYVGHRHFRHKYSYSGNKHRYARKYRSIGRLAPRPHHYSSHRHHAACRHAW